MNKFKICFLLTIGLFSMLSHAATVLDTKIDRIYVQSLNGSGASEAHAISIDKVIDSSCGNRLHIEAEDKELLSTMLAYKLTGTEFDLIYAGAPAKKIDGHLNSGCKLLSVY